MRPIIDNEKCRGCWKCKDICPSEAIMKKDDKAYITVECTECGICMSVCANSAIFYEEVFVT